MNINSTANLKISTLPFQIWFSQAEYILYQRPSTVSVLTWPSNTWQYVWSRGKEHFLSLAMKQQQQSKCPYCRPPIVDHVDFVKLITSKQKKIYIWFFSVSKLVWFSFAEAQGGSLSSEPRRPLPLYTLQLQRVVGNSM